MSRLPACCALAGMALRAFAQGPAADVQIEQARQFSRPLTPLEVDAAPAARDMPDFDATTLPDDSFGAQVMFKRQERAKPFTAYAEVSAFFTNNVALAKRERLEDKFLVLTAGGAYARPLGSGLRAELAARVSVYRYEEFRELDFQSVDVSGGLAWAPEFLRGGEIFLRYLLTSLTTAEVRDEFYKNHAVLLGVQKVVPFARAHAAYYGASAQASWAEPQEPGRDEYAAFAGYHLQATEHLAADLSYRYGYFVYRQSDDERRDQNHTLSLGLRYAPVPWAAISANTFLGINRSNLSAFDYEVWNAGIALQISVKF